MLCRYWGHLRHSDALPALNFEGACATKPAGKTKSGVAVRPAGAEKPAVKPALPASIGLHAVSFAAAATAD